MKASIPRSSSEGSRVIQQALDYLANQAQVTPEAGEALRATLTELRAGTPAQQQVAEVLVEHITFRGSQDALTAVLALQAALQTQQGRRAAGLPARGRAPIYDARRVDTNSDVFKVALLHAQGRIAEREALDQIIEALDSSLNIDDRTARAHLRRALPLAQTIVAAIDYCHKAQDSANT